MTEMIEKEEHKNSLLNFLHIEFSNYPNFLLEKEKLLQLLDEQEKEFWNARNKKESEMNKEIKEETQNKSDKIFRTLTKDGKLEKHIYNLENFVQIVEKQLPLNDEQKKQLSAAFLLTQAWFEKKTRKTWGIPAFSHIKEVVKLTLETECCDFDRVTKALLHDNIEDLKEFDRYSYNYLFGKEIVNADLQLSHKPWYHRIGFLPKEQRILLHKKINEFIEKLITDKTKEKTTKHEKTRKFATQLGKIEENNYYEWLDMLWHVMDPDDADLLRKQLLEDPETQEIMQFCLDISDFRYFNKKLDNTNLPIKFADRLQNTRNLFNNPIKSIYSLFETEYHFFSEGKIDENKVEERMKKFPLKNDTNKSHYDILKEEIPNQKEIARNTIQEKGSLSIDFNKWYKTWYNLYKEKSKTLETIDKIRKEILQLNKIVNKNRKKGLIDESNIARIKKLEEKNTHFFEEYNQANKEFIEWMNRGKVKLD